MDNEYYDDEDKSYDFYDGDIEDINTGEDRSQDPTPAKLGIIPAIICLLSTLIILSLTSVIYHRDKKSLPLSHLIMAIFGVLASAFCAFIFFSTSKSLSNNRESNNLMIGIALLMSLLFFGYFLASAIYLFMYRPFHYGFMVESFNDKEAWNKVLGDNWSFEEGWGEDRRIIWWIAFFNLVACIGFLVMAILFWQLSRYKIQTAKMCVGAGCFAGVIVGCFAIDYLVTARKFYGNYVLKDIGSGLLTALFVMLIVMIVLLVLNAVSNILKKRSLHFLFAILLIISLFILVCFIGLALRDLRNRQFDQISTTSTCSSMLDSLHEEDIKDFCPSKYLKTACTKKYLVSHWETDNSPIFINPSCCQSASNHLLWPLYICGCLTLLLISATLITIAYNLYLSDKSEYLEIEDKSFGLFEIIFAALCLITVIAFAFYWGFRSGVNAPRSNINNPDVVYSGYLDQGSEYVDKDFDIVDINKIYEGNVPSNALSLDSNGNGNMNSGSAGSGSKNLDADPEIFTGNAILSVDLNDSQCPQNLSHCGMRIAILVINGQLVGKIPENIKGSEESRILFYEDRNLFDDFALIFGKELDLNNFLSGIKVIPHDIGKKTVVAFIGQQVDLSTLNSLGLKPNENTSSVVLTANGTVYNNFANFMVEEHSDKTCYYTNSCTSTLKCFDNSNSVVCEKAFVFYNSDGQIDVKIPLKVLDVNDKRVAYPDSTLKSHSFYTYNNKKTLLNNVNLVDSHLVIKVPKPVNNELYLDVSLYDSANHYLPKDKNYTIPVNSKNPYLAEELLLLTKNGKGCVGSKDETKCWSENTVKFDTIEVLVKSEEENKILPNKKINLYNSKGVMMGSAETDINGFANFPSTNYDYYSVNFDGDDKFIPANKNFTLSSNTKEDTILYLNSKFTTTAVLEQSVYNTENSDQDFSLKIKSNKNKECTVDPLNKWCAYAQHINDVQKNQNGFEKIKINKFTISHYLAYLKNSPAYSGTCPAADFSDFGYYKNSKATIRSLKVNIENSNENIRSLKINNIENSNENIRSLKINNFENSNKNIRSLEGSEFDWENVRKLAVTDFQTLYCFTGWGLNSVKSYRVNGSGEPDVEGCVGMFPESSKFSLDKLVKKLNA